MTSDDQNIAMKQKTKVEFDSLGYGLTEITVRKLTKESFHSKFGLRVNFRSLQNTLADGCRVFGLCKIGFLKDDPIEVIFVVHVSDNSYNCQSITFAEDFDESKKEALTKYLRLEVARLALSANCHNNYFLGEALPELQKEASPLSIGLWASLFIVFFIAFRGILHSLPLGFIIGIALSFGLSQLLRPVCYYMTDTSRP